eukprot:scaffold101755_cov45-Phaeocystis_antarctica.AAC.1
MAMARAMARAWVRHPARRQRALGDDVVEREDAVGHEVIVACAYIHAYMTSLAATETLMDTCCGYALTMAAICCGYLVLWPYRHGRSPRP